MINRLDELLVQLGTGKWSIFHFVAIGYCFAIPVYHAFGGAFFAPRVDYTCVSPTTTNDTALYNQRREDEGLTPTAPTTDNRTYRDECTYLVRNPTSGEVTEEYCTEWEFDNSTFSSTITGEFSLVCDKEYLRATYQTIYMTGIFFGSILTGFFADKYGRKTVVGIGGCGYALISIASAWVPDLTTLMASRFLLGFLQPFTANIGYILAMEVSEPRLRPMLGIVLMLPWAMATMAWGGFAYAIRDWRTLHLTVSLLSLLFIPTLWVMDESPRWLAVRGRSDEALRILKKAAKWNKSTLPPEEQILQLMEEEKRQLTQKTGARSVRTLLREWFNGLFILVRTPRLRKVTLCLYMDYVVLTMVYYGVSLSGGNLSNDPFVYMVLMGLMEVPAYSLTVIIVARFGRRIPSVGFFLLTGAALIALAIIPSRISWLVVFLAMVGKVSISSVYQIIMLYSTELFPTEVRSRGIGTCFMLSRVGSMISPFITEFLGTGRPWAPSVVFAVGSLLAASVTMMLPETLGVPLPDTVAGFEARTDETDRKSRSSSFVSRLRGLRLLSG